MGNAPRLLLHLKRAIVALVGRGANQNDDAVYPFNCADADDKPVLAESSRLPAARRRFSQLLPSGALRSVQLFGRGGRGRERSVASHRGYLRDS